MYLSKIINYSHQIECNSYYLGGKKRLSILKFDVWWEQKSLVIKATGMKSLLWGIGMTHIITDFYRNSIGISIEIPFLKNGMG